MATPSDPPDDQAPNSWWERNVTGTNSPLRLRFRNVRWWISPRLVRLGVALRIVPKNLVYVDELTTTGRRYVRSLVLATVAFLVGAVGLSLLEDTSWREVLAGALLAWGVSLIVWARVSYQRQREDLRAELTRVTEVDLLHARLNRIDHALGLIPIDLDQKLQAVIDARMERLAHFGGVEEFRSAPFDSSGDLFWDEVALGQADDYPHD